MASLKMVIDNDYLFVIPFMERDSYNNNYLTFLFVHVFFLNQFILSCSCLKNNNIKCILKEKNKNRI